MDAAPLDTKGTRVATLMGAPEAAAALSECLPRAEPRVRPAAPAVAVVVPQIYTVETIRAAKRTAEVVR